jgi:hypothetical protein
MRTFQHEEGFPLALKESLYAVLEGSIESSMFRKLYGKHAGALEDVINNGDLACAFFVSSILSMFELISGGIHTTVQVTLEDMEASGWQRTDVPEALAVVLWGEKQGDDGRPHFHIGICLDGIHAIEHSAKTKSPRKIGITELTMPDGTIRSPVAYFVHPKLQS